MRKEKNMLIIGGMLVLLVCVVGFGAYYLVYDGQEADPSGIVVESKDVLTTEVVEESGRLLDYEGLSIYDLEKGDYWQNGLAVSSVSKQDGQTMFASLSGDVDLSGEYYYIPEDSDCSYDCGRTCFNSEQNLPFRNHFCFGESDAQIFEQGSGYATMTLKKLNIPFEGVFTADVENVKK